MNDILALFIGLTIGFFAPFVVEWLTSISR